MPSNAIVLEDSTLGNGQRIVRVFNQQGHDLSSSWWEVTQGPFLETHHHGTAGNDQIQPFSAGNNLFYAGAGDDHIIGHDGHDVMYGEHGNDHLEGRGSNDQLWAGSGDDWLEGGDGDDILSGMNGNDRLDGGAGNDRLYGGSGNNIMTGGTGRDTFSWSFFDEHPQASDQVDTIRDFTLGEDKLMLTPTWRDLGSHIQLSLRQEGSQGILELRNTQQEQILSIKLENTDLLSVRDDQGSLIETLSSQAALQRLIEQGALDCTL